MVVDYNYNSLTYECQVLNSELSTCLDVLLVTRFNALVIKVGGCNCGKGYKRRVLQ